ncbi:MAG: hypothetical protein Kapaf2KO_18610 [Candidatus Kapaibacteriales bacterium]
MIKVLDIFKGTNIVGVKVSGKVDSDDLKRLDFEIEEKVEKYGKIRFYTDMIDHEGWTALGILKDGIQKVQYAKKIEKSAVVASEDWDDAIQLADQLTSGEMRRFSTRQEDEAIEWIKL